MKTMVVLGIGAMLAACSANDGGAGNELAQADPQVQAKTAADAIMAGVPRDLGGGVAIAGAKADGRELVLALTGMADWRPGYTDEQMAGNMKRAICFQPGIDPLLAAKGRVRLQSRTAKGVDLPPLTIDRC
jgi:hypothetical protein